MAGAFPKSRPLRKPGQRLTAADRLEILTLHRKHPEWTFTRLADACRCDDKTARLVCLAASEQALELMAAYALPAFTDWRRASRKASDRGDHRPARDWLMHAGIVDPLPDTGRFGGTTINIINAPLPGTHEMTVTEVRALDVRTPTDHDGDDASPSVKSSPHPPDGGS